MLAKVLNRRPEWKHDGFHVVDGDKLPPMSFREYDDYNR